MQTWAQAWLVHQCKMIAGMNRAVVLLGAPDRGPYLAVASWPDEISQVPDADPLIEAARSAMAERGAVVREVKPEPAPASEATDVIAIPFLFREQLAGAIAVEAPHRDRRQQQGIVQLLYWGAPWLELLVQQQEQVYGEASGLGVDLITTALKHDRFSGVATAVVTKLASSVGATRASVGYMKGSQVQVQALSNSAHFSRRTGLLTRLSAAMDEAVDQEATVVLPPPAGAAPQITRAHEELAREGGCGSVCSVPLEASGGISGCVTLERETDRPFGQEEVSQIERAVGQVGPLMTLKRGEDRWLLSLARDRLRRHLRALLGPEHPVAKACALAALSVLIASAIVPGRYRIGAAARLEGIDQRVIAAPVDGFVTSAAARAGDVVSKGDLLATLDDRELRLERLGWASQRKQLAKEYTAALATHDAVRARILQAQLAKAEAQLELLDEQIARTRMRAPFEGIVVSGDLSQSLGAPVEKGQVLFTIAALDAYRVILEVDERDIAHVKVEQPGHLALSAMPGEVLSFHVHKITPISTAAEGRNFFRVEANLDAAPQFLRPGMEGIGKVDAGRRRFLWLWTHEIVDWMRLALWSWW